MDTPIYIRHAIRRRLGLDMLDYNKDAEIDAMLPHQRFREVTAWFLDDPVRAESILRWARDCGIDVPDDD
jgi:hypothetical protein